MQAEPARPVAAVFAALGDETRLSLLSRLGAGPPLSITELARGTGITRQGISKHLKVLEGAGIVASESAGRENRYAVHAEGLAQARAYLEQASRQWDEAVQRLRGILEE